MNMQHLSADVSRHALGTALLVTALSILAPSSLWARPLPRAAAADSAADRSAPVLQVENDNWLDMRVYVIQDDAPTYLGTVGGLEKQEMELPPTVTPPGGEVQLLAVPIAGGGGYLSEPLIVSAGDVVSLTVGDALPLSSAAVWPGR